MRRKRVLSKYDKHKYGWLHFGIEFVLGAIVCLIILSFLVGVARVDGVSMLPALKDDQVAIYTRHHKTYDRGDIIAIKMPEGDNYVKRVIALPGETIDIKDGKVFIDGAELDEPYLDVQTDGGQQAYPLEVPEGKLFAMGDNRPESVDSRAFGPISYSAIKGKLIGK